MACPLASKPLAFLWCFRARCSTPKPAVLETMRGRSLASIFRRGPDRGSRTPHYSTGGLGWIRHGAWPVDQISLLPLVPLALVAPLILVIRRRLPLSTGVKHAFVLAAILGAMAAPWYVRNLLLYHNLTANVEATSGLGAKEMLKAAPTCLGGRASRTRLTAHYGPVITLSLRFPKQR